MSTAKIRKALALLSDGPDSDAARTANAALRDVDAIEKAARIVVCGKVYGGRQDEEAALALFEEIERQARESK